MNVDDISKSKFLRKPPSPCLGGTKNQGEKTENKMESLRYQKPSCLDAFCTATFQLFL